MYFTGFADEASKSIEGQIEVTKALGWKFIEARQIDGTNLHDVSEEVFEDVCCKLADAGIGVNCFGSCVANWGWEPMDDDHFEQTKKQLERAIVRMKKLNCTMLRGMSFKAQWERPAWDAEVEKHVFSKVNTLVKMCQDAGVEYLHENCNNYGGQSWKHTLKLLENVPGLKLIFDTGNPVLNFDRSEGDALEKMQDSFVFYSNVKDFIRYVHIKDGVCTQPNPDGFGKTTYTVTYKVGETTVATDNVLAGSKLSIPSMLEQTGKVYTFSVGGEQIDPATYVTPASNITVNVLVEAQKFTVTIKDGSTTTELDVAVGETFELPAAYIREGYISKLTYDGNVIDLATFEMPAYDIDVRVAYDIGTYTVTFTDGETTVTHKGVYKTAVPTPTQFVAPTGYKTIYSIDDVDVSVVGMTVPGKDTIVNVRYEKATYNAIFKANGKTYATVPTVYEDAIELPATPATYSEGGYTYTFKAWTGYTEGMTMGAENVTFEAEWTKTANDYEVKFVYTIDGVETVVDTQTVTFGTAITAPALPESFDLDGYRYTFTAWEGYTEGMLLETEGATFAAVYERTEVPTTDGVLGDINGDGLVDIEDITAVISAASGTVLDPEQYPGNTELTGDGLIDIEDITAVISIASGSSAE